MGIKDEDKDKLFHMFNKLDDTKTANKGGTGLGLVISNKLAQRLGSKNGKCI